MIATKVKYRGKLDLYLYKSEYKAGVTTLSLCHRDGEFALECGVNDVVHTGEEVYISHVYGEEAK